MEMNRVKRCQSKLIMTDPRVGCSNGGEDQQIQTERGYECGGIGKKNSYEELLIRNEEPIRSSRACSSRN